MTLKINDKVEISTPWADKEFPNTKAVVTGFRFGGAIVNLEASEGTPFRTLHTDYLKLV